MPYHSATATASSRNATEDRVAVHALADELGLAVALADGVGGMHGGGAAADVFMTGIANALAADPANRTIIQMLSTSYEQKVDLLKRTTEMARS